MRIYSSVPSSEKSWTRESGPKYFTNTLQCYLSWHPSVVIKPQTNSIPPQKILDRSPKGSQHHPQTLRTTYWNRVALSAWILGQWQPTSPTGEKTLSALKVVWLLTNLSILINSAFTSSYLLSSLSSTPTLIWWEGLRAILMARVHWEPAV